jgi:hypothetical protein
MMGIKNYILVYLKTLGKIIRNLYLRHRKKFMMNLEW